MNFRDQVFIGDVLEKLREIPDGIVQCCVTSPPYFNLRDYGMAQQIGLETTPEEYIAKLVKVFQEVRRVLRNDGVLFLNLGDTYAGGGRGGNPEEAPFRKPATNTGSVTGHAKERGIIPDGLKPKDLLGIPWMAAFALRTDSWWLRSDIIWSKENPMPESVTDRPTKSHEYVFLLTKNQNYFYDQEAIKEPSIGGHSSGVKERAENHQEGRSGFGTRVPWDDLGQGRNKRSVWTINTKPYKGAHFAVMPEELASLCIKAGSSEKGCCPKCGAPWERIIEKTNIINPLNKSSRFDIGKTGGHQANRSQEGDRFLNRALGWKPSCQCNVTDSVPCLILDPFAGSGTTLSVAAQLGRSFIGIEINPEYGKLIEERVRPSIEYRSQKEIFDTMMDLPSESE